MSGISDDKTEDAIFVSATGAVVSRKWSNAQPTTHETSELRGCRQSLGGRRKVCVNRALFHLPGGSTMLTTFDAPLLPVYLVDNV